MNTLSRFGKWPVPIRTNNGWSTLGFGTFGTVLSTGISGFAKISAGYMQLYIGAAGAILMLITNFLKK